MVVPATDVASNNTGVMNQLSGMWNTTVSYGGRFLSPLTSFVAKNGPSLDTVYKCASTLPGGAVAVATVAAGTALAVHQLKKARWERIRLGVDDEKATWGCYYKHFGIAVVSFGVVAVVGTVFVYSMAQKYMSGASVPDILPVNNQTLPNNETFITVENRTVEQNPAHTRLDIQIAVTKLEEGFTPACFVNGTFFPPEVCG